MGPDTDEELRESLEFLRQKLNGPPEEFNRWANELLDKAHGNYVEQRRRRSTGKTHQRSDSDSKVASR